MGYLSGGTTRTDAEGNTIYDRKTVLINTVFFVIGTSFAFFLLALGMNAVGRFFSSNQLLFARIGGIIVILFGLYQLGVFGSSRLLSGEYKLPIKLNTLQMSPITALIMGFVISFAWTPCIGPVLSSVLIMAGSAASSGMGYLLIGVYTLGYVIPFLLVGLFTATILDFFKQHRNVVKYSVKIGGVLLLLMGILIFTGKMNGITSYLSTISSVPASSEVSDVTIEAEPITEEPATPEIYPAPEFTLTDQYGNTHSLSDYRGKIIFLNFWATWCPPCKAELPYIEELYQEYSAQEDPEVVFLGVTFPGHRNEQDVDGIKAFLDENGYSFPVLMNEDASLAASYYITAFPTTFLISPEGNLLGYIPGGMTKEIMEDVIRQAKELSE